MYLLDATIKPGPGAYSPKPPSCADKPSPPKFSMGVRHSEFVTPLILEVK